MPALPLGLAQALQDRYRLDRELGQGGMATVYLAHDLRNNRKVALKVLRPELAAILGAERFLKEIETTANLQHPHILPLFDSGVAASDSSGHGGPLYYVMPYVEGESLRARLEREKQLPIADAVRIASEVASALDYAHRRNILHRDIKPENILLHDGQALVADFGIALAMRNAGGTRMTETGLSLGTPQYMSPEQATAERDLDARSDIYALGAVTYEMLTGEPPFTGNTTQAIIAKLMTETPRPVSVLRKAVAPAVEEAVLTALEKLPADRFASAAEFSAALAGDEGTRLRGRAGVPAPQGHNRLIGVAAALALAGATFLAGRGLRSAAPPPMSRQRIVLGSRPHMIAPLISRTAIAPDNSAIVFTDSVGDHEQLWIKERGEARSVPLKGTEGGSGPTFSPDGRWIAFIAGSQLMKVPREGGPPTALADSADPWGSVRLPPAWLDNGSIAYIHVDYGLALVGENGGPVTHLTAADSFNADRGIFDVTPLPGGRGLLLGMGVSSENRFWLGAFDLKSGKLRKVTDEALHGWFLPPDQLVYLTNSGAFAAPFDLGALTVTGAAVPILDSLRMSPFAPLLELQLSPGGSGLYVTGSGRERRERLVWVDRSGTETPVDPNWEFRSWWNGGMALSPDEKRVAVTLADSIESKYTIAVKQLPDGPLSRLTFEGDSNWRPAWSPDGKFLLYVSDRGEGHHTALWRQRADGSQPAEPLLRSSDPIYEGLWSRNGQWLVYRTTDNKTRRDALLSIRAGADSAPRTLVSGNHQSRGPALSPDGRWLAYMSDESGRPELFVSPFPNAGDARWQVSSAGGSEPLWAPDGRELFFIDGRRQLIAAQVTTAPTFSVRALHPLFPTGSYLGSWSHRMYEISADGRRFLMIGTVPDTVGGDLILVENLQTEIGTRLGPAKK